MSYKEWEKAVDATAAAKEHAQNGECPVCSGRGERSIYIGCDCTRDEPYNTVTCRVCGGTGALICRRPGEEPMIPKVKISEAMARVLLSVQKKRDRHRDRWVIPHHVKVAKATRRAMLQRGLVRNFAFYDYCQDGLTPKGLAVRQELLDRKEKVST